MGELQATQSLSPDIIEQVIIGGDLSKLLPAQRVSFYNQVCESLGLNPLTKPFEYITLNGKLVLYAKRDCTDQLRKIHKVSLAITAREKIGDVYVVTARARNADGREDESTGVVSLGNYKGDALANLFMKAETKAKRRVTLSICGLGFLDESETDTVQSAPPPPANPLKAKHVEPTEYKPTFGKFKGQLLTDIDIHELANYVSFIENEARKKNQEIKGQVLEFITKANELIESRDPRRGEM